MESREVREVEKYRAITWGGLKFFLGFVATLVLTGNGVLITMFMYKWIPDLPGDLEILPGVLLGMSIMLGVTIYATTGSRRRWIEDYWRRNIRGYEACFWIKNDEGVDPDVSIWVEEMRRPPYWAPCEMNGRGKIFLRVPLGGWFRRSGLLYRIGGEYPNLQRMPFRAWRVIVRKPITDPLVGACIEVIDGKGDRIPFTVSATLRFAEWLSAGGIQEWRHQVPDLLRAVFESRAELNRTSDERDEVKKRAEELERKWKTACQQREDALSAIAEAIGRIDATKRFIKSDQAQTIRTWLNGRLAAMAPVGAPGTVLGARETLTQPAACEIGVRACKTGSTAWDPKKRLPPL
jgi:hypothetical protein